jgi:hypothetical protein
MSAPLKTYRVYCLDAAQRMVTADWIEAASDEEAIARAEADGFGSKCEIWEGQRLVAKLDGERREA